MVGVAGGGFAYFIAVQCSAEKELKRNKEGGKKKEVSNCIFSRVRRFEEN